MDRIRIFINPSQCISWHLISNLSGYLFVNCALKSCECVAICPSFRHRRYTRIKHLFRGTGKDLMQEHFWQWLMQRESIKWAHTISALDLP